METIKEIAKEKAFRFTLEWKTKPPNWEERLEHTENGERSYAFIAYPNDLNSRKRKAYVEDFHITANDIEKLMRSKLKGRKHP